MVRNILRYTSVLSALPAVVIGYTGRHIFWWYALLSLICDVCGLVLRALDAERLWLSNIFIGFEFILVVCYFIRHVFPHRIKTSAWLLSGILLTYFIIHTIFNDVRNPNYFGAALFNIIYILCCLYGFFKLMREMTFMLVEKNPLFVFCVAFLLYASGNFIIFLFEHKIWPFNEMLGNGLWAYIHNPLNTVKNLLIAYGLWLLKQNK